MAKRSNGTRKRSGSAPNAGRGQGGASPTPPPPRRGRRSPGAGDAHPTHASGRPAAARGARQETAHRTGTRPLRALPRALCDGLVHRRTSDEPRWKLAPLVLALAFAVRAAVALSGDFVLHPDEIMQYLEPAHRLVFGNGVTYWEYFYGARSWLIPGVVAAALTLFDLVGLGEPAWYVGGVKLLFCALSLAVPAGMYCFARRHFGESAARTALLAGAFWYELAAFAHKPLTELVATAPLVGLLALCVRPEVDRPRVNWHAAGLAVLTAAVRMHYAPIALVLLAIVFLRTRQKLLLTLAGTALLVAVGIFDGLTWGGDPFHSYVTNLRFNLLAGEEFVGADPAHHLLWWFVIAGGGAGRPVPRGRVPVAAALRPAPRIDGPGAGDSLRAGAQGVPIRIRLHPAVAADRRRSCRARGSLGSRAVATPGCGALDHGSGGRTVRVRVDRGDTEGAAPLRCRRTGSGPTRPRCSASCAITT